MCVAQEVADRYCAAAMQLNVLAEDRGISQDELKMRKADLLLSLMLGDVDAKLQ